MTLIPPGDVKLDLKKPRRRNAGSRSLDRSRRRRQRPERAGTRSAGGSWWAARAQAGEVSSGFTKDEITAARAAEDPRAEDGVFTRVSGLLRELSEGRSIG